ncbi:restriction endonuclease [Priestia megaterium]|nr:restriction endonuclease [Priestia megaterium]
MQGQTYEEEKNLGLIWSPQIDQGGTVPHSWKRMTKVKAGDRVFHFVKGDIVAVSDVKSDCRKANKPSLIEGYDRWDDEGYLVPLKYYHLDKPVNIRENFDSILPLLPIKYSAFQNNGKGNQGYLFPCNEELALKLIELISELNIYQIDKDGLEFSAERVDSPIHNELIHLISETESEVKAKIRLGQRQFRQGLLHLWNSQCALCNIKLPDLLRASHSKPWKDSTNEERLDPYNGLLLCCNHDALYDKGYITFDGNGSLYISPLIGDEDYSNYNISSNMKINYYPQNRAYFKWHKKNQFKSS